MWLLELKICTPIIFLCLWGSLHWPSTRRAGVKLGASNSGLEIVRTKPEYTSLIETCPSNQTPPPHHVLTTKRYYPASTTIKRLEIDIIFWNSVLFTNTRFCRINSHSKSTVNAPTLIILILSSSSQDPWECRQISADLFCHFRRSLYVSHSFSCI